VALAVVTMKPSSCLDEANHLSTLTETED